MFNRSAAWRMVLLALAGVLGAGTAAAAAPDLLLDEHAWWRCYYRYGADLVSPAALRAEGERLLGQRGFQRLQKDTEQALGKSGLDGFAVFRPSALQLKAARRVGTVKALGDPQVNRAQPDWTDCVFLRMFYDPYTAPPPPDDWMTSGFDDASWVLERGTFQQDLPNDLPPAMTTGNMAKVHIGALQYIGTGLQACCYRTRFVVDDPERWGEPILRLVYRGGVRVFLNGHEVVRGHLPAGELAADTSGEDYPEKAYEDAGLRDRALGPVKVPKALLVKGVNVLAVEVRASDLHPILLTKEPSRSWNALHDREKNWRHAHLTKLELRCASSRPGSVLVRPAGVQVWVADIHHRVDSTEFRAPGEDVGTVRIVGARNGTYSAQAVVGTDRELTGLKVTPGALQRVGGTEKIPASAVAVLNAVPYPADEFTDKLGDERGLDATFPDMKRLAQLESPSDARKPCVFDHLTPAPGGRLSAGTARPVWISLRIPPDAKAGEYRGSLTLTAQGMEPVDVPVEAEVVDWALPDPGDFQTFVACEQNPYAVAKQYDTPLWSKEHFRLLEASFRELGRIGNTWLNVPVLTGTEFGNRDDSPIRWIRKRDGTLAFDYTVLDKYVELALKHWGKPRVIMFVVMHGIASRSRGDVAAAVKVLDERTGRTTNLAVGGPDVTPGEKKKIWETFAKALYAHMKAKGLGKSMRWGYPLDSEVDHDLVVMLSGIVPEVYWVGGPHQIGTWGYKEPKYYKAFGTVRYFNNWPTFRMDRGWKSEVTHLAIGRIDSSVLSVHTTSHPFAFRVFTDHALALGRSGICRVGADEWASAHYDGMHVPTWIVGMPVLFTLWPGPDGAEPSTRFEALLEGIQETEVRIFLEKAVDRGRLPKDLADRVTRTLREHFLETGFFQNKLCIHDLERYPYRWQERSRRLYRLAAEVAEVIQ